MARPLITLKNNMFYKFLSETYIYKRLYNIELLRKIKHYLTNSNLSPSLPLHGDQISIKFFKLILNNFKVDCIIETGTYKGFTTAFFAKTFPNIPIYTCEIDEFNYKRAKENLKFYNNVHVFNEPSPEFIKNLIKNKLIGKRPFFYLDAHWLDDWPLESELKIIFNKLNSAIILIDDFKVPGKEDFTFDKYHGKECSLERVIPNLNKSRNYNLLFPNYGKEAFNEKEKELNLIGYTFIFQNLKDKFNLLLKKDHIKKFYKNKSELINSKLHL